MPVEIKIRRPKMYRFPEGGAEAALKAAEACLKQPWRFDEYNRGFLEVVRNHLAAGTPLTINQASKLFSLWERIR